MNTFMFLIFRIEINGIKSVISTSETRKITVIMKKCIGNGNRVLFLQLNPHSKGEAIPQSKNDLFLITS